MTTRTMGCLDMHLVSLKAKFRKQLREKLGNVDGINTTIDRKQEKLDDVEGITTTIHHLEPQRNHLET